MTHRGNDKSHLNAQFARNDYYVLSAGFHGTTRLALQQFIWKQALGFNIHPTIPKLAPTASVADVACGTTLWLIDTGREIGPASDLHGLDINLNQAPPSEWLPKNLKLHHWNLFEEVPLELVGKFDLVHVRLITVVIKDNDPTKVAQNLYKLLKPGGYLQWDEVDTFASFVVKSNPELQVPGMDEWCAWMSGAKSELNENFANHWNVTAVDMLRKTGFETAERYDLGGKFMEHLDLMRYQQRDAISRIWN